MSSIEKYPVEFVRRTKEILNEHYPYFEQKDREVTFLLNCLLGLIITSFENAPKDKGLFNSEIDGEFLELLPDEVGYLKIGQIEEDLISEETKNINLKIYHKSDLRGEINKLNIIRLIRNAIAHQNMEAINEDGNWIGIKIWNMNRKVKNFEAIFSNNEIKVLANYIAEEYLRNTSDSDNV